MNPVERPVRRIDRYQQDHRGAGFVFGVVKKFGDDRGGALAALLAYYGFLSLFPLLLLMFTVVGYVLPHYPGAEARLTNSVLREFPVIGPQLGKNIAPLRGSVLGLVVGSLGLIWGALGVTQIGQLIMAEVWAIPGRDRPGFPARMVRGLLLFAVLGVGVVATTVVSALGTWLRWGPLGSLFAAIPAVVVNIGVFFLAFRVLTPKQVASRVLWPGVVVAGIGWQILQTLGVNLVAHQLKHASQVYGTFGLVLGLLSFLSLAAQLTVYAAEVNVVLERRLWPRSIVQPPLTGADRKVLAGIVRREERRPEQTVEVGFDQTPATSAGAGAGAGRS